MVLNPYTPLLAPYTPLLAPLLTSPSSHHPLIRSTQY
jgi:hypothetical protein